MIAIIRVEGTELPARHESNECPLVAVCSKTVTATVDMIKKVMTLRCQFTILITLAIKKFSTVVAKLGQKGSMKDPENLILKSKMSFQECRQQSCTRHLATNVRNGRSIGLLVTAVPFYCRSVARFYKMQIENQTAIELCPAIYNSQTG